MAEQSQDIWISHMAPVLPRAKKVGATWLQWPTTGSDITSILPNSNGQHQVKEPVLIKRRVIENTSSVWESNNGFLGMFNSS